MKLNVVTQSLHPRNVFRISRAARGHVQNVFVELHSGGVCGRGEASPNAFYGETAADVAERLRRAAPFVAGLEIGSVADIKRAWAGAWSLFAPSRAAQCALDLALWDGLARREGVSVAELALGVPARPIRTFCTVGISDADELARKAAELRGFPWVKIKSDARADLAPAAFVREQTGAALAVDANCAWEGANLTALSRALAALGGLFIEQPLPPAGDDRMPELLAASVLPILADESCVTMEDVERLPGRFSGFNVKLVKCGGLTPALAMVRRGRALGLRTMVGCMLESSLLIAAGMVAAQGSDYADLDGAWLLRDDPFEGTTFARGVLTPGPGPGFGVEPRLNYRLSA
ncbi:MAG: dipeptide epimerase [Verrucomicrobiota bacterium]